MRLPETLIVHPCNVYYPQDERDTATADNLYNCCYDETQYFTNWAQDLPSLNKRILSPLLWNWLETFCKTFPPMHLSPEQTKYPRNRLVSHQEPTQGVVGEESLKVPRILAARLQLGRGTTPVCLPPQPGREAHPKAFRYRLLRKSQDN